jgi:2-polyprenyl-3-methyl-5-hydroxy-6-metoxy-1,4-benzoquinol methylase
MNCLLCQSEKQAVFDQVKSFGFPLVYYQCQNCGLVFQSAEESLASDPEFYQKTYRKIYQADVNPTEKDIWVQKQRAEFLVGLLGSNGVEKPEWVVDIGASTGLLLKGFHEAMGSDVVGVEPGDAYRQYAETQGITMFSSIDDLAMLLDQKFNLVTMIHVLEHLADPIGYLKDIRERLLDEKGHLLIEVPNFYAHDSYELAHLTCFTPRTLQEMVMQAGYQILRLVGHGVPRSSLMNLYTTVLAEPMPYVLNLPAITPERFVRLKRQLGLLYRRIIQKLLPRKAWLPLPTESSKK